MAPSHTASLAGACAPSTRCRGAGERWGVRFAFVAAALLVSGLPSAGSLAPWPGGATPALAARDLDGSALRLDQFHGRAVLINFWATWCAPCVQEMPSLQRLRDRFAGNGFEVIGVNHQENAARIRPFLDRYRLSFPVVRDHDGSIGGDWGVRVYPTSFLVRPDGRVALAVVGELDWDDPAVIARVQSVIGH